MNKVDIYCSAVLSGKIPAGIHLINAITRYQRDLKRKDLFFDQAAAGRVVEFFSSLNHFTGNHDKKPFILAPWEEFIIYNLYGFYWKGTNSRRYQNAYIEVARKNGKTALVAGIGLYHLVGDGEAAAEILLTANSKDQAKICFNMVKGFTKGFDPNEKYLKRYRHDILYPRTDSFIRVLAADSDKMDGYNCSLGVVDEYHSAPNSQVRDVIRSSQGMRQNPMLITITTAGFDKSLPCWELRTVASEVAAGIKEDDSFFSVIFSLDEEDDWKDPASWVKSNPNIDITVSSNFIGKQVLQAINSPSDEVGVRTKNLNQWCDSATVWIPDNYVIAATRKIRREDFYELPCYVGVDLSSNIDLTAVAYLYEKEDIFYFFTDFYLPHESLKTRPDKELYKQWQKAGYLTTTPGNVTDYDYITKDILKADQAGEIALLFYDKYNATQWAIQCTEEGINLEPFSQTIGNFNSCTKAYERLILSGKLVLDDNPITRYCIRNVDLRSDYNGNVKPMKNSEKKKIDGVIAELQALAAWMKENGDFQGTNIF